MAAEGAPEDEVSADRPEEEEAFGVELAFTHNKKDSRPIKYKKQDFSPITYKTQQSYRWCILLIIADREQ